MANKRKRGRPSGTSKYEAYSREYDKVKSEMESRGYSMKETKYTKQEWEQYYTAEREARLEKISKGERKTTGNINRDLIKEQTWRLSKSQAKAQRRAYEIANPDAEKVKLSDIRGGKVQAVDWNAVSARNKELRNQGYGWGRVHSTVSQEFFGS